MTDHTDNELRRQVARLLKRRPGWALQVTSTPGVPSVWRFATTHAVELSLTVEAGSIRVVQAGSDDSVLLPTVSELVEWLRTNNATSLTEPRERVVDKIRRGELFKWS